MPAKFDPLRHPRDSKGRFTKSRTVLASAKEKRTARAIVDALKPANTGNGATYAVTITQPGQERAAHGFAADAAAVNDALRAGHPAGPAATAMDDAMRGLPADVVLHRKVPQSAFAGVDLQTLQGMKVRDAGFSATQLDPQPADKDVHLFIAAPRGSRAVVNASTGEVYLDRDSEMVVTHVESNSAGGHDMYLTLLPKQTAEGDGKSATPKGAPNTDLGDSRRQPAKAEPAGSAEPDKPQGEDEFRASLMKQQVPQLQAQMRERGLKPGRKRKSELVDALAADEMGHHEQRSPTTKSSGEKSTTTDSEPAQSALPAGDQLPVQVHQPGPPGGAGKPTTGDAALQAAPVGLHRTGGNLASEQRNGLVAYQDGRDGVSFQTINGALRSGNVERGSDKAAIAGIDAAMAESTLAEPVQVWRGIRNQRGMFGDRVDGDLTGLRWREDGFVSTSADPAATTPFSRSREPMRLQVATPAGTRAVDLSDPEDPSEAELLLDRGHEFEVVKDHGVVDGVRQLDVRMLPKTDGQGESTADRVAAQARVGEALQSLTKGDINRGDVAARLESLLAAEGLTGQESPELVQLSDLLLSSGGRIRQAIEALLTSRGRGARDGHIMIADLRDALPGLSRSEFDEALRKVAYSGLRDVRPTPESNQKTLTQRDWDGALWAGNQTRHLAALTGEDEAVIKRLVASLARRGSGVAG